MYMLVSSYLENRKIIRQEACSLPQIRERLRMHWMIPNKWIIQELSSHGTFNVFRKKCKFRENDHCRYFRKTDDNEHAIMECEYFEETRRAYSRIMQFGAVDVSVWIRRRDTYGALEQKWMCGTLEQWMCRYGYEEGIHMGR